MLIKNKAVFGIASHPFKHIGLENLPYYVLVRPLKDINIVPSVMKEHFKCLPHSEFVLDFKMVSLEREVSVFITVKELDDKVDISLFRVEKSRIHAFNITIPFQGILGARENELECSIYANYLLIIPDINQLAVVKSNEDITAVEKSEALALLVHAFNCFFDILNDFDFVVAKQTKHFKKPDKTKSKVDLLHITSRKYVQDDLKNDFIPNNVEWSHSWLVRGHWRLLRNHETIGKDRNGNRCELGRTWVNEFIKNKGLPFTNPLRIVS